MRAAPCAGAAVRTESVTAGPGRHEWLRRSLPTYLAQGLNAVQRYAIRGERPRRWRWEAESVQGDDCRDHRAVPPQLTHEERDPGDFRELEDAECAVACDPKGIPRRETRCHASRGPSPPQLARCDPPPAVALGFSAAPSAYHPSKSLGANLLQAEPSASRRRVSPATGRSTGRAAATREACGSRRRCPRRTSSGNARRCCCRLRCEQPPRPPALSRTPGGRRASRTAGGDRAPTELDVVAWSLVGKAVRPLPAGNDPWRAWLMRRPELSHQGCLLAVSRHRLGGQGDQA